MNQSEWIQTIGISTVIVFLITLVLIPIVDYYNKLDDPKCSFYEINFSCEMSNNSTLILELFIAGIFAIIISTYFYRRQEIQKEKRLTFAINRLENQLYDLEPEFQNLLGLLNRANRLWNDTTLETQEDFTAIINSRRNDIRRTLESIQGTLRISFDVLEPMLSTRIDYFSRNGIEYCETDNPFNLLIEQFNILNNARQNILLALPRVKRINTDIFV